MKTIRTISALALFAALAMLAPAPALGQHTWLLVGTDHGIWVPATDQQIVRVTVGNPQIVAPTDDSEAHVDFFLKIQTVDGEATHTIDPGASYTFTLDPREVGVLLNPRTALRHVKVSFRVEAEVVEGRPAPQPSITIEIVNAKSGEVVSFDAFPGFTGGVFVAAGDVN